MPFGLMNLVYNRKETQTLECEHPRGGFIWCGALLCEYTQRCTGDSSTVFALIVSLLKVRVRG